MVRVRYLLGQKDSTVWTIEAEEPVLEAIQLMADKHIGDLPVVRDLLLTLMVDRDWARLARTQAPDQQTEGRSGKPSDPTHEKSLLVSL